MTVLPIVERELRVTARRRGTYWSRVGAAATAIGLFGLVLVLGSTESIRGLGKQVFVTLSIGFLLASLMAGVVYTADCLSEEKREGTLGLLFLTDLKGYDVVLGKLAASSVVAVYGVLAILPVLAIPLLMGGVSGGEFGRVVLVLVNTLFFSLAVGVRVSASFQQGLVSMAVTLAVVVAINLVPPLGGVTLAMLTDQTPPEPWLMPSLGYAFAVAHEPLYNGREHKFLISLAVTHAWGWLFLVASCQQVQRSWHEGADTLRAAMRRRLSGWLRGSPKTQRLWRARSMDLNPCYWLGGRLAYRAWIVWATLGVLALLWLAAWLEWGRNWANEGVALLTVIALHTLLRVWLAGEATLAFGPDRRSGALELILCTDLSVPEIVQGRLLALQRQFLGPAIAVLLLDFFFLLGTLKETPGGTEAAAEWLAIYLALMLVFVIDMVALAWFGLWKGLLGRQATRAFLGSLARIFALPWVLWIALLAAAITLDLKLPPYEWVTVSGTFAAVRGATSVWAGVEARRRLLQGLRSVVAGTASPAASSNAAMVTQSLS